MDHRFDFPGAQNLRQLRRILHAQLVERKPTNVVLMAARKIVDDEHVVSMTLENVRRMRADVSGPASNENGCHYISL